MNTLSNLPLLLLKHKIYGYFKIYIAILGNKQRESQLKNREGSLKINEPKDGTLQFQIEIKATWSMDGWVQYEPWEQKSQHPAGDEGQNHAASYE